MTLPMYHLLLVKRCRDIDRKNMANASLNSRSKKILRIRFEMNKNEIVKSGIDFDFRHNRIVEVEVRTKRPENIHWAERISAPPLVNKFKAE
mmetsp:Transcript_19095/g.28159  ORF Transcript_19095/g.28159 Transcript_19095/m.28159 type:complete len:92 (+) Transcript_19095:306-581(+)